LFAGENGARTDHDNSGLELSIGLTEKLKIGDIELCIAFIIELVTELPKRLQGV